MISVTTPYKTKRNETKPSHHSVRVKVVKNIYIQVQIKISAVTAKYSSIGH